MPLATITHQGKSWPINEFVGACLKGECQFPAAIAATIIRHVQTYDNHGTISGSGLHAECDYKALLERSLDYSQEITELWPASFRGANVHGILETCRDNPRFKDWVFEKRLFAALDTDGDIFPLFPAGTDKKRDWKGFEKICQDLREEGFIILSGALDAFDIMNGVGHDYKTKSKVWPYTQVSDSWRQQMIFYTFLARLHGYQVDAFKISVMDATGVVVLDVELPIEEVWVHDYLIPRVRKLNKHQQFTMEEIRAVNEGPLEPPQDFPEPIVNYLCDGKNKAGKIYCPIRHKCIKWRKTN